MNAITRVYHHHAVRHPLIRQQRSTWGWKVKGLIVALILSAFAVVYLKDLNRRAFIQYQDMAHANQQSQVEWGKLLLEQSTLASQANIERNAGDNLRMYTPDSKNIVLITTH